MAPHGRGHHRSNMQAVMGWFCWAASHLFASRAMSSRGVRGFHPPRINHLKVHVPTGVETPLFLRCAANTCISSLLKRPVMVFSVASTMPW